VGLFVTIFFLVRPRNRVHKFLQGTIQQVEQDTFSERGDMTNEGLRLLAIFAHPDDESLGAGSTLAKYAAEGVEVHLICATKGERGWTGSEKDNPGLQKLGRLREKELHAAAQVLGIAQVYFLDYVDGDLDQAPQMEAIDKIAGLIREIRPQVVLSFGPDGIYGHPDHIVISQFSSAACIRTADISFQHRQPAHTVSKFYYMVIERELSVNYAKVFGDIRMNIDGVDRTISTWEDWAVTTTIDGSKHWRTVLQAVNCHQTQVAIYADLNKLSEERSIQLWGKRTYYRVFSFVNSGRKQETDLFDGLR
jgi:LmbE family N-acetylglucosaminyl deacetylase